MRGKQNVIKVGEGYKKPKTTTKRLPEQLFLVVRPAIILKTKNETETNDMSSAAITGRDTWAALENGMGRLSLSLPGPGPTDIERFWLDLFHH